MSALSTLLESMVQLGKGLWVYRVQCVRSMSNVRVWVHTTNHTVNRWSYLDVGELYITHIFPQTAAVSICRATGGCLGVRFYSSKASSSRYPHALIVSMERSTWGGRHKGVWSITQPCIPRGRPDSGPYAPFTPQPSLTPPRSSPPRYSVFSTC